MAGSDSNLTVPQVPAHRPADQNRQLMAQARALETVFLSEMLAAARPESEPGAFGGGVGEQQFASFLRGEQARLMVEAGGIGLAETLFRSLGGKHAD